MIRHAYLRWENRIDSSLWSMTVNYATYVVTHFPSNNDLTPVNLFTGSYLLRYRLLDIHTQGCLVYVFDPTLQAGKNSTFATTI